MDARMADIMPKTFAHVWRWVGCVAAMTMDAINIVAAWIMQMMVTMTAVR